MIDVAIISSILGKAADTIQNLKKEGFISHEGLIIDHNACEAEYRIDLNLGEHGSRTSRFKNIIKSKLMSKITIDVIYASGSSMMNENLIELGMLEIEDGKLTIDFPKILKEIKSGFVIMYFRTKFPTSLRSKLIHRQAGQANTIKGQTITAHFDIVLDYANMWYSNFTSFSVRNIIFNLNQNLNQDEIKNALPEEIRKKLERADKNSLTKGNARKYLQELQKVILDLQSKEFLSKLENIIEIDPTSNCEIIGIFPSMRAYNLPYSNWTLTIPDLFTIKISANIEDRETAIHATASLNLEKYRELLKEEFRKFKSQTKKLKF